MPRHYPHPHFYSLTWSESESEIAQSCPTLCDPMDYSLPGFSVHGIFYSWDFPGKCTRVGCHFLLQGIFPSQGSNSGLLHCRETLYPLSQRGSLDKTHAGFSTLYHHSMVQATLTIKKVYLISLDLPFLLPVHSTHGSLRNLFFIFLIPLWFITGYWI